MLKVSGTSFSGLKIYCCYPSIIAFYIYEDKLKAAMIKTKGNAAAFKKRPKRSHDKSLDEVIDLIVGISPLFLSWMIVRKNKPGINSSNFKDMWPWATYSSQSRICGSPCPPPGFREPLAQRKSVQGHRFSCWRKYNHNETTHTFQHENICCSEKQGLTAARTSSRSVLNQMCVCYCMRRRRK